MGSNLCEREGRVRREKRENGCEGQKEGEKMDKDGGR